MCDLKDCSSEEEFAEWEAEIEKSYTPVVFLCSPCHYRFMSEGVDGSTKLVGYLLQKWRFVRLLRSQHDPDIIPWNPEGESDVETV